MPEVNISAVRSVLGARTPLSQLHDPALADDVRAALAEDFVAFRESDEPIWRSAAAAAELTMAAAEREPDLIVYVSQNDDDTVSSLPKLAQQLTLRDAELIAVAGHECGNLGPALQCARDALLAERSAAVLLVLADHAVGRRRVMDNGLSVFSDGAVACLMTRARPGAAHLRLDDVVVTRIDAGPSNLQTTARLARDSVETIERRIAIRRADVRRVAFSNYRWASQQFLAAAVRLPVDRVLRRSVSEVAHCFSADVLVNIAGALADGELVPEDRVLGFGTGPWSWSTIAVSCVGAAG